MNDLAFVSDMRTAIVFDPDGNVLVVLGLRWNRVSPNCWVAERTSAPVQSSGKLDWMTIYNDNEQPLYSSRIGYQWDQDAVVKTDCLDVAVGQEFVLTSLTIESHDG